MTVKRSIPRRPAWLYPVGSILTMKDGRSFKVTTEKIKVWDDPSMGHGGGDWVWIDSSRYWREL